MDRALERVLRACKSNCEAFRAAVETRVATSASELWRRVRPIAGG